MHQDEALSSASLRPVSETGRIYTGRRGKRLGEILACIRVSAGLARRPWWGFDGVARREQYSVAVLLARRLSLGIMSYFLQESKD